MKVYIADDQRQVRSALRLILEHHNAEVIGEANHYQQLFEFLENSCPDVLLFDWELPGNPYHEDPQLNPLPVLMGLCPAMQVVVLSSLPESRLETSSLACCFISKADPADVFLNAVTSLVEHTAIEPRI
jgi:DNA-binding NarL/FixJ family response regulator